MIIGSPNPPFLMIDPKGVPTKNNTKQAMEKAILFFGLNSYPENWNFNSEYNNVQQNFSILIHYSKLNYFQFYNTKIAIIDNNLTHKKSKTPINKIKHNKLSMYVL